MEIALDKWIEGFLPGEWHIMGIPMKELKYGHMVLMERMMCYPIKTEEDIAHCVIICSKDYKDANDYINHWKTKHIELFNEIISHIKKDVSRWLKYTLLYFNSHSKMMQSMIDPGVVDSPKLGSPFLAIIRVIAISKLNYNPLTLNEAPFAPLMLDIQTHAELNGRIDIAGGSDAADAIEKLKQRARQCSQIDSKEKQK